MGSIYTTDEVEKVMNGLIDRMSVETIANTKLSGEPLNTRVKDLRQFRKFIPLVVEEMRRLDEQYAAEVKAMKKMAEDIEYQEAMKSGDS